MLDARDMSKRLCYIENFKAYFVEDFDNVTGDDWNDIPYEINASEPYKEFDATIVCFDGNFITPEQTFNTSVDVINAQINKIPWLYFDKNNMLMPGATLEEFIRFVKLHGGKIYAEF